jgi:hypothetical protein
VLEVAGPSVVVLSGVPAVAQGPVIGTWDELPVWQTKNCTCPVGDPPTEFPDTVMESVTVFDAPKTTNALEILVAVVLDAWATRTHSLASRFAPDVLSSDEV